MNEQADQDKYWEARYRDALERLEAQGREVQSLERRMRQASARLAVAGLGGDAELSQHLESIRTAARAQASMDELFGRVNQMGEYLRRRSRQELRVPEATSRPESVLRRLLLQILIHLREEAGKDEELDALALRLPDADRHELARGAGVLERHLARRFNQEEGRGRKGLGLFQLPGKSRDPGPPALSLLLTGLRDRLDNERLNNLQQRLDQGGGKALMEVCRDLVGLLEAALDGERPEPVSTPASEDKDENESQTVVEKAQPGTGDSDQALKSKPTDDAPEAGESGFRLGDGGRRLIHALSVPEPFVAEARSLLENANEALTEEKSALAWMEALSELIQRYRAAIDRERDALRQFLQTVLSRLSELEKHVGEERRSRARQATDGRKLDEAVARDLRGIQETVRQSRDLGSIGKAINQRLNSLDRHLSSRRRLDQREQTAAEKRLEAMASRLKEMESEADRLREQLQRAEKRSTIDPLTKLPNRRGYEARLRYEFERHRRHDRPLVLAVCDLDDFKLVNDQLGHAGGDDALSQVAEVLRQVLRETDFVARFGGEEFVLLLPETELEAAVALADRLREKIRNHGFEHDGVKYGLSASFGVAAFSPGESAQSVFRRADEAVYRAKQNGRNQVAAAAPPDSVSTPQ
ncbi:diguanylate cyclase [Gammaproteobacteria bacterium AB-CW1]|uniref:diguanylate cyclase n=1 Tax=Natronospira elongata TaxID=3110268 RepID=A0AAP6MJV1_9GAMM|nr:diguanylate cyclase [Gammaproteobacteria bacterium AB-CW1]